MAFEQKDLDRIVKEIITPPPKPPVNRRLLVDKLLSTARARRAQGKGV